MSACRYEFDVFVSSRTSVAVTCSVARRNAATIIAISNRADWKLAKDELNRESIEKKERYSKRPFEFIRGHKHVSIVYCGSKDCTCFSRKDINVIEVFMFCDEMPLESSHVLICQLAHWAFNFHWILGNGRTLARHPFPPRRDS